MADTLPPPGLPTRALARSLSLLRRAGVPLLAGVDDVTLRTNALGLTTAIRRTVTGAPAVNSTAAARRLPASSFARLGPEDRFALLPDNRAAFEARCAALRSAREQIHCALYYLADDAAGAAFADELVRAAGRGVRVCFIADEHSSREKQYGPFPAGQQPHRGAVRLLERLAQAGIGVLVAGSGWSMHRKFLAIDRGRVLLGGRNVADHYASPGWRDLEIDLSGPFAARLAAGLEGTFHARMADPPPPDGVLLSGPDDRGDALVRAVRELMNGARETLDVEHAYLLSHSWFEHAVGDAVRRGVRVRVVSNSGESNDLWFMNWRLATSLEKLRRLGAQVHRRRGRGATLHTKLVVADARRIVFGSSNLDYFSPTFCAEADVGLDSEPLARALVSFFEAGLADPSTEAVRAETNAHRALLEECRSLSVSRLYDLLLHELQ